jgi:fructokinase
MSKMNTNIPIEVICAGEALIDLFSESSGKRSPCLGGSVYNLARALALQGVGTGYLNPLSSDLYGQQLRAGLQAAGVSIMDCAPVQEPTSLAVVNVDEHGKAAYTFDRVGVADRKTSAERLNTLSQQTNAKVVCTGCLALSPDDAKAYLPWLAEQKRLGSTVCIDVNVRAAVIKDETAYKTNIYAALQYADIIKASDDDLAYLQISAEELLAKTNAKIFLLTLGAQGAKALTCQGQCLAAQSQHGLQVIDTVGAGDCFFAGFIAHWLKDKENLQAALDHAVRSAGISVTRQGCQPPTWDEAHQPPT